jgi:hypothetical protein
MHRLPGVVAVTVSLACGVAQAQATSGAASSIVLPVAANTASFETEVFVRNPGDAGIQLSVLYYVANGIPGAGLTTCNTLQVDSRATVRFTLATQCPTLGAGATFGMLVLRDAAVQKLGVFHAYSRVQHVATRQGFSVEGFPEAAFSGRPAVVIGLKREAGAVPPTPGQPGYQANCFVSSLGESVTYQIRLLQASTGTQIGNTLSGFLAPYQLVRYLDVFSATGLLPGDLDNVAVEFDNTSAPDEPAFVGFCTLQDNRSFGADFRIAKSLDAADETSAKRSCRGTNTDCDGVANPAPLAIADAATALRFPLFVRHPDFVRCDILGPASNSLELRLMEPAEEFTEPAVAQTSNNSSALYFETGPRNAPGNNGGVQGFWSLEVSAREGVSSSIFPVAFGLRCRAGAGVHIGDNPSEHPDDF